MKLSVVITAYDKHDVTKIHVEECMNSTRVPDEIIVVNDHGDPGLKDMLKEVPKKTKLIYAYILDDIEWNYTGARNLGFFLSTGDIVCLEDNDNISSRKVYEDALNFMEENPDIGRVLAGRRPKVYLKDIKGKEMEEWNHEGVRPAHQDTQFLRREVYMRVKGCDERFAGRYAWACSDWRRRLMRAGVKSGQVKTHYFTVVDGETTSLLRRKSYKNYQMARESDGHTQSKSPLLNFNYEFEELI